MKYYIKWAIHVSQPIRGAHDLRSIDKWVLTQFINEKYFTYKMKYLTWLLMRSLELHQYKKLNMVGMEWWKRQEVMVEVCIELWAKGIKTSNR